MNTLIGPSLKRYIYENIKQRVKYIITYKKFTVKALSDFIHIFKNSNYYSFTKGRANNQINRFENNRLNRRHKQR